ncbi:hypothetical protein [Echinicola vietnamensis]|uniref:TerB family tellurite resistance protein n=1 Tax=Echinicola vietnamensis (strain DSM 17526 / LMG 23754 / KMM 6221) TaxID=926556 RepID=L0G251_ECHVK|nr:hypothetical protein [Echinicola vietnamensis]AGA80304.1 hypothetical protein Echvi_4097 [Echinicola vietnamensis DSM 17526]
MMKIKLLILMLMGALAWGNPVRAQSQEAVQLVLNFEKLNQLKQILQDMYKGYHLLSTGYKTVKGIAEGDYKLHEAFLDGMLAVSPEVRRYYRIAEIVRYQQLIIQEYTATYRQLSRDGKMGLAELEYLSSVYRHLFKESLKSLDELAMVLTSGKLRMDDHERIEAIDRVFGEMQSMLVFVRKTNSKVKMLNEQRKQLENNLIKIWNQWK